MATISINAVLGENGLIRKAEHAKELHENSVIAEREALDTMVDEYEKAISGGNYTDKYLDNTLPVAPRLSEGMTKVKYNKETGKWEKVEDDSTEWYNYDNKEWANVVLGDATFNSDGTLDESKAYTQLVWIPRFAYKIKTQYHTSGSTAGEIDIVFVDSNNQNKSKTTTYKAGKENYPTVASGGMNDFIVHPAFDYDGKHLTGFWMGKFESSNTNCTPTASTGNVAYTGSEVMCVRPNVTSWRNMKIGDAFTTCLNMNKEGNAYGLPRDSVVDPHMVKNDEWGAVAYLSKSKYGKQTEEVFINNNRNYITGIAGDTAGASSSTSTTNAYNTTNGVKASTTGNITGIYDMSGGNWERVAAYVNNGHGNLGTYGADLVNGLAKYKNVYTSTVNDGSHAQADDYALIDPTDASKRETAHYGDAVWETSSDGSSSLYSWYSDYSGFPYSHGPFFRRGGSYSGMSGAGMFFFSYNNGAASSSDGFRVVVPVF